MKKTIKFLSGLLILSNLKMKEIHISLAVYKSIFYNLKMQYSKVGRLISNTARVLCAPSDLKNNYIYSSYSYISGRNTIESFSVFSLLFLFPMGFKRYSMNLRSNYTVHPLIILSLWLYCMYFGFTSLLFNNTKATSVSSVTLCPVSCLSFKVRLVNRNWLMRDKSIFTLGCPSASYSTTVPPVVPVKLYKNADKDQQQMLKENINKSGVYRWVNLKNGNTYIGSSVNLRKRLGDYCNNNYLNRNNMVICKALLYHGHHNFRLEILEYCSEEKCIKREQYFMDLLNPEYNILKLAGSNLGFKHSPKSKIWEHLKKINFTPENIERLAGYRKSKKFKEGLKAYLNSEENIERLKVYANSKERKEHLKDLNLKNCRKTEVFDTLNNETTVYPSMKEAAKAIGCVPSVITEQLKYQDKNGVTKLIKKRFIVRKLA